VIPYFDPIEIPEEDSVALQRKRRDQKAFTHQTINIAVIGLPHMANYTDFAALEREAKVALRYPSKAEDLSGVDAVILPGTKSTLADLAWLRSEGWGEIITSYARNGGRVIGICGGFQMLGEEITDPHGLDGKQRRGKGLRLLPLATEMLEPKITERIVARSLINGCGRPVRAYEIHMGRTKVNTKIPAVFEIMERAGAKVSETEGAVAKGGRVWGTYLHGIFADPGFRRSWLADLARLKGISKTTLRRYSRNPYDAWAAHLRKHLDTEQIVLLAGSLKP
jgi:adenosylcobyric acid synthase